MNVDNRDDEGTALRRHESGRPGAVPCRVKRAAGFDLWQVQNGLEPSDWKPMNGVGAGVREIRIRSGGAWRVLYVARFTEAVYVLHAFGKKTPRTAQSDLDLAAKRYAEVAQR